MSARLAPEDTIDDARISIEAGIEYTQEFLGAMVKADKCAIPFGATPDEFEAIKQTLSTKSQGNNATGCPCS